MIATTTGTSAGYRWRLKSIFGELLITSGQAQRLEVEQHSQLSPELETCCLRRECERVLPIKRDAKT